MPFPVILLVGQAGAGKDTVADAIGGQKIALADPMKRLATAIFGFTEQQLWGPSECRNAPDTTWGEDRIKALREEVLNEKRSHFQEALPAFSRGNRDRVQMLLDQVVHSNLYNDRFNRWLLGVLDHALETKQLTPRYVLQTLGTEFGRSINIDLWINEGLSVALTLLDSNDAFYNRVIGVHGLPESKPSINLVVISDGRFRNEVLAVKRLGGHIVKVVRAGADGSVGVSGHASEAEQKTIPDDWFDVILYNNNGLEELGRAAKTVGRALLNPLRLQSRDYRIGIKP